MKSHAEVQRALMALGYDLGKGGPSGYGDDGLWGAKSRAAMIAFQSRQQIAPTGIADKTSIERLFPGEKAAETLPPWYQEARRLIGLREIVGKQHSSTIMGWAKRLGIWYPDDETAWCGLFVAHCMGATLPTEPQPSNPLGARNWSKFGRSLARPAIGAMLVFWRGSRTSGLGHVGFYAGERKSDGALRVLGGNQANSVSETWLERDRLVTDGIRWPTTYPMPTGASVLLASDGKPVSRNEA